MKSENRFICEVCNTEFSDEAGAALCEASHNKDLEVVKMEYKTMKKWPTKITIEGPNGTKKVYVEA